MDEFDDIDDFDDGNNEKYMSERDNFLNEFRQSLIKGETGFHYDLYDWVMLADYAQDVDDSFLRNEAINRGLQAFPDSPELLDRRLLLYAETLSPEDTCVAFTSAYNSGIHTKLVRMYHAYYLWTDLPGRTATPKRGYKDLSEVLFDGEKLYDLEIIEALRLISQMGAFNYLEKDYSRWEANVLNKEMLWYETFPEACSAFRYGFAEKIADKLVADYPYNRQYWMMKAQSIISQTISRNNIKDKKALSRLDEVTNTIETILAIEPNDEEALALRNKTLELKKSIEDEIAHISEKGPLGYNPDRQPWDPMSLDELRALLAKLDMKTQDIIEKWVEFQIFIINVDTKRPRKSDSVLNIYGLLESLYLLGELEDVDYLLAEIDVALINCDGDNQPVLPLKVLRLIQQGQVEEATQLFTQISSLSPWGGLNPTKLLLSVIVENRLELHDEAMELMIKFREEAVDYRLNYYTVGDSIFKHVDSCVLDYFITKFVVPAKQ